MITFKTINPSKTEVYLSNVYVGQINKVEGGYQYSAYKSTLVGDVFPTLEECQNSLK